MDALSLLLDWITPKRAGGALVIGIAGAQGSGKSTLATAAAARLTNSRNMPAMADTIAVSVSLDDFYRPRAQRLALARGIHPLLATRGVPGTHDLPLLQDVLLRVRAGRPVSLPVFDKRSDDRLPPQHWRRFDRIDLLLLEGWCVGARAQPAALLATPMNGLEAGEDPKARWRTHVNQTLAGGYQRVWAMLDGLAFLAAPDWATVPRWRAEQEAAIGGRMDAAAIARFCAHYERLTRWQLADTPRHAGLTLRLDGSRRVISR